MAILELNLLGTPDTDPDELHDLCANLRTHLLELDVDDVRSVTSGAVPEGTKSGEAVTAGALAVVLAPVLLRGVLQTIETWLKNRPLRKVTVTMGDRRIELDHSSREDRRLLVEGFVRAAAEDPEDAG